MQTKQMRHKKCRSGQNTDTEGVTSSDGNGNRHLIKIVSFPINNITGYGYSKQLITEMMKLMNYLMKKLLRPEETRATAIITPT